jgi:TyrR family helix-turn-helix protein
MSRENVDGVGARDESAPAQGTHPSLGDSPAQRTSARAQLERLYVEDRLSERQIAERLGISQSTVHRHLRQYGITRGQQGVRGRGGVPLIEIPEGAENDETLGPRGELVRVLTYVNGQIAAYTGWSRSPRATPTSNNSSWRNRHDRGLPHLRRTSG